MKRILTLLLAAGTFTAVQAQTSREEARRVVLGNGSGSGNNGSSQNRDVILGGGNNRDSYPSYPGNYPSNDTRSSRIDQINREYDNKIQSIRSNRYLNYEEKQRAIRQLEKDRQARIKQLGRHDRNKRYDSDRYDNRKDNGKHKGWYKNNKNKNWKKGKGRN